MLKSIHMAIPSRANVIGPAFCLAALAACSQCNADRDGARDDIGRAEADLGGDSATAPAQPDTGMVWFEDDYDGALAKARERGVPIVVALWAPWCHTCLSMHNEVLPDPGLAPLADRFVWLKVDTDRAVNAPVLSRLSIEVWPTFYILSPDEEVQARLTSAASVAQFRDFLIEGERAHLDAALESGGVEADSPLALARQGDQALSIDDFVAARDAYEQALAAAPNDWTRRPDVLVSYMHAAMRLEDADACADIARSHIRETGSSTSAVRFSRYTVWCAEGQAGQDEQRALFELSDRWLSELLAGEHQLSSDDQSTALRTRRRIYQALDQKDEARDLARRQRELLDRAAAKASSPLAAATYSWPRSEVYTYLGEPEALLPDLVQIAGALPGEYDPPYRVAWLFLQAGDLESAQMWAARALELAYGPRKAQVFELLAEIHRDSGDDDAERDALERLVAHVESLPPSQQSPDAARAAQARLQELPSRP